MKIQYLSDLHLEFNRHINDYQIAQCESDVIVLAGDIGLSEPKYFDWVYAQTKDKSTVVVLGNHEFYRQEFHSALHAWKTAFEGTHVHVLENDRVVIDEVTFLGATLWTDYRLFGKDKETASKRTAEATLNDHLIISIKDEGQYRTFSAGDAQCFHERSLAFFEASLKNADTEKTVVISHHAPSDQSVDAIFEGDDLNVAFASNLEEWVLTHKPTLWVHGHMHNSSNYRVGDTQVVCNPRGYSPYELNRSFVDNAMVNI